MLTRELCETIERLTGRDGIHPTAISQVTLYRYSVPSVAMPVVYDPSFCLIAQGGKDIVLGEERFRYDAASYLLVSIDLPATGRVVEASSESPYLAVQIALDPGVVGELLSEVRSPFPLSRKPARGLSVSPLNGSLLDAVTRLVRSLQCEQDLGVLAPLTLREIYYRLIVGEQGHRLRQICTIDSQAQRVASAIRWLKQNFAEAFRIEELARKVHLSPSALHHYFKAVTAMSPLQYQKRLRLQEARRLMLGEGLDAATAGFRVGYESPSQFSREYRRLFGASPKRDAEALRKASLVLDG